jgi:hypothetical protein
MSLKTDVRDVLAVVGVLERARAATSRLEMTGALPTPEASQQHALLRARVEEARRKLHAMHERADLLTRTLDAFERRLARRG